MASPQEIKRWLEQLRLKPRLLLLGRVPDLVHQALKNIDISFESIVNPLVELGEVWRRMAKCQAIVVFSDFDPEQRTRLLEAFGHVPIASIEDAGEETTSVLEMLEEMIVSAQAVSDHKPEWKDQRTPGHHSPKKYSNYNALCTAICELPQVTRIRYFKYAGRDLYVCPYPENAEVSTSKTDLRVRTTDRCGIVVSIVCDHPVHLETAKIALEELLKHHE